VARLIRVGRYADWKVFQLSGNNRAPRVLFSKHEWCLPFEHALHPKPLVTPLENAQGYLPLAFSDRGMITDLSCLL
jgi:hypothetical protein